MNQEKQNYYQSSVIHHHAPYYVSDSGYGYEVRRHALGTPRSTDPIEAVYEHVRHDLNLAANAEETAKAHCNFLALKRSYKIAQFGRKV